MKYRFNLDYTAVQVLRYEKKKSSATGKLYSNARDADSKKGLNLKKLTNYSKKRVG